LTAQKKKKKRCDAFPDNNNNNNNNNNNWPRGNLGAGSGFCCGRARLFGDQLPHCFAGQPRASHGPTLRRDCGSNCRQPYRRNTCGWFQACQSYCKLLFRDNVNHTVRATWRCPQTTTTLPQVYVCVDSATNCQKCRLIRVQP
jgi:hypothetical protein